MYKRNYPSPDSLPPNYNGTAFNCDEEKPKETPCSEINKAPFSLPDNLEGDDILLGALIIMLLKSHSDDELLIILALLLLS